MDIKFFDELDDQSIKNLRDQNITLEDWDYILVTHEVDQFYKTEEKTEDWCEELQTCGEVTQEVYYPKSDYLERMLRGCYQNTWSKIVWEGKEAFIGIAYHG